MELYFLSDLTFLLFGVGTVVSFDVTITLSYEFFLYLNHVV